mmetsp:Transcript_22807/g.33966  ORF Transcript_22807/g.33966 Transcript_22807/m.33966 type:complete len:706 (-) Transcript_22807:156-2273(-)
MTEVDPATSVGGSGVDYETLLNERNETIESLKSIQAKKDEELALLRSEFDAAQIKHKEETYWLRLETNNLKNDKQATDDRIADLYRDLREIDDLLDDEGGTPVCTDPAYVLHLQAQLSKSVQTMGVLDNQMSLVKRSCDMVVQSMKEEIADVMEDKCQMEVEVMNKLAILKNEKVTLEDQHQETIKQKNDVIKKLERKVTDMKRLLDEKESMLEDATCGGVAELLSQLDVANNDNRNSEKRLRKQEEAIRRLEEKNAELLTSLEEANELDLANAEAAQNGDCRNRTESGECKQEVSPEASINAENELARVIERISAYEELESELRKKITNITEKNKSLLSEIDQQQHVTSETVSQLEETKKDLEGQLRSLQSKFDALRREQEKFETLKREKNEAEEILDRAASMLERVDESIQDMENKTEKLNTSKKKNRGEAKDDEGAIPILETASLLYCQVKVSLLLVESKLKNQFMSLKTGKLRNGDTRGENMLDIGNCFDGSMAGGATGAQHPVDITEMMTKIQDEALDALAQVKVCLLQQMAELREEGARERENLYEELDNSNELLSRTQKECAALDQQSQDLEEENKNLRRRLENATTQNTLLTKLDEERRSKVSEGIAAANVAKVAIRKDLMEKLQKEILVLVNQLRDKNESIFCLTAAVNEQKAQESALKKELKRLMKRVRAMEEDRKSISSKTPITRRPQNARAEV